MKGHDITWEDDGAIGFRCHADKPGSPVTTSTIHGLTEGDKVVTCPRCGQRLKASWSVTLVETDEPETVEA